VKRFAPWRYTAWHRMKSSFVTSLTQKSDDASWIGTSNSHIWSMLLTMRESQCVLAYAWARGLVGACGGVGAADFFTIRAPSQSVLFCTVYVKILMLKARAANMIYCKNSGIMPIVVSWNFFVLGPREIQCIKRRGPWARGREVKTFRIRQKTTIRQKMTIRPTRRRIVT
jgi:hypothetical protein